MKKTSLAILTFMLSIAGVGHAQSPSSEIRESTDPSKAAEVEQHAKDIEARRMATEQMQSSGDSGKMGKMHKHGKRSHMKKHGGAADQGSGATSK